MTATEPCIASPPDWDRIDEEIHCPLCDYLLRGLIEPRCPECGYRFDWPDLIDPTRRLHPYLFEHHPERNIASFRRTLLGGVQPRRFWTSLHPVQPSRPRRLVAYWFLVAMPVMVFSIVLVVVFAALFARDNAASRAIILKNPGNYFDQDSLQSVIKEHGSLQAYLNVDYPDTIPGALAQLFEDPEFVGPFLLLVGIPLTWPWMTYVALLIFSTSMRRAKVNRVHVLRCVLYSSDVLLWLGLLYTLSLLPAMAISYSGVAPLGIASSLLVGCGAGCVLLLLFAQVRLWIAYRTYLRFSHALATVLASQIVVLLVAVNLLAYVARR